MTNDEKVRLRERAIGFLNRGRALPDALHEVMSLIPQVGRLTTGQLLRIESRINAINEDRRRRHLNDKQAIEKFLDDLDAVLSPS